MAKVKIQGHASGTGILTVTAPNTSTDRTITLPDATGTLLNSDGSGASLTNLPSATADGFFASSGLSAKDLGVGLHIKTADSGASVGVASDELVIEGSGNSGISILSGTSHFGGIYFGDSGDNDIGKIEYEHNGNRMIFTTNAAERLRITSDGRGLSQFTAKVWCSWDNNGTTSFHDSHNCSSLTDNAAGDTTVNFTNNMGNALYTCTGMSNDAGYIVAMRDWTYIYVGSIRIATSVGGSIADARRAMITIFGD